MKNPSFCRYVYVARGGRFTNPKLLEPLKFLNCDLKKRILQAPVATPHPERSFAFRLPIFGVYQFPHPGLHSPFRTEIENPGFPKDSTAWSGGTGWVLTSGVCGNPSKQPSIIEIQVSRAKTATKVLPPPCGSRGGPEARTPSCFR